MAFTYDITTERGQVRLGLGDTTAAAFIFEDDEIDYFLSKGGTVTKATVEGLRVLLASKAHRVKRARVHGLSIDDTAQIAALQASITELGGLPTIGVMTPALLPSDRGYVEVQ